MPATARRGSGKKNSPAREVLTSGPYKGVKNTTDPFDDTPDYLVDAANMYVPDAQAGSGIYARPGFALTNSANQLGASAHMGQGIHHHTGLDGLEYNFLVVSGKLYRASADLSTYTDITPVGITIDSSFTTRVQMLTFADMLIVSDGVNKPWMGTGLALTPINGASIQYDTGNSSWSAQHMTVYSGALVFVIKQIGGIYHQTRLAWSAPFDPAQGYFNAVNGTLVDYTWDLVQTGSTPITAIQGTNLALIYWRDYSMGALTGPIGPSFQNSSSHDAIDFKVGTRAPATIALFGNTIFFCDSDGRAQMYPLGNRLVPIWLNMRSAVEGARTDVPSVTALTAVGMVYQSLSLYVAAIWSPSPSSGVAPSTLYVLDTLTGAYVGRWIIAPGINIETMGILKDANGQPELVVIGTKVAAINNGFGGYVWRLTNPQENIWKDNGVVPNILAQTARMGFDGDRVSYADKAVAITGSTAPCMVTALSSASLEQGFITDTLAVEGLLDTLGTESGDQLMAEGLQQAIATPSSLSLDGTYRVTWGLDIEGRGVQLVISPTTADAQWRLHRVEVTSVSSMAAPEEA